jgi:hypothetical protein
MSRLAIAVGHSETRLSIFLLWTAVLFRLHWATCVVQLICVDFLRCFWFWELLLCVVSMGVGLLLNVHMNSAFCCQRNFCFFVCFNDIPRSIDDALFCSIIRVPC